MPWKGDGTANCLLTHLRLCENKGDVTLYRILPPMTKAAKSQVGAAERAEIFHEQYGDEIDAGSTLADLVIETGNYLSRIVGPDVADEGMARIVAGVVASSGSVLAEPREWRTALHAARGYCYSEWPLGGRLHDLAAYAIYGIALNGSGDEAEPAERIEELVTEAESFIAATPVAEWRIGDDSELSQLVRLASNRWALDNGRPIEPAALAVFGGVTEGRIRNMMSGANRTFSSVGGRIPAQEALAWLAGREEFWNSIWREQRMPQYGVKRRPPLERAVFVPVARDGSTFHPGLRRGSGYTIGEKGAEIQIEDFDEALAELQRLPIPYWRRPNSSGHWGVVAGVRWERLDASDLDILAANPDYKLLEGRRA